MIALTAKEIPPRLKTIPKWSKRAKTIHRTFKFAGFPESLAFVNRIAKRAIKADHHPEIEIRFDQVTLQLTTHDAGGLTEKDFALARHCDEDFTKLAGP